MKLQFLTPTLHGVLDYLAAGALIILHVLLGLHRNGPLALWLSVAGGVISVVAVSDREKLPTV
ncbi:hypothetical protein ABTH99_18115, partial [Acinetobacter baumannii]